MDKLPDIRHKLAGDAQAGYEGDPAATSPGETIFCYPSMYTMVHHRIAHELYSLKVPLIPRIISEMAHSRTASTSIPGPPSATTFSSTTARAWSSARPASSATVASLPGRDLGALSFPKNADGTLTKGIPRHPILEDKVTVYAGATILGRVTVGRGAVIGGNVWITETCPPGPRSRRSVRHEARAQGAPFPAAAPAGGGDAGACLSGCGTEVKAKGQMIGGVSMGRGL